MRINATNVVMFFCCCMCIFIHTNNNHHYHQWREREKPWPIIFGFHIDGHIIHDIHFMLLENDSFDWWSPITGQLSDKEVNEGEKNQSDNVKRTKRKSANYHQTNGTNFQCYNHNHHKAIYTIFQRPPIMI